MIPSENNPFRTLGNVEQFVTKYLAEDDKKPLIIWFDKFEKVLKKLGTNYQKSSINPTDALEFYYDSKTPEEAAKSLAESVEQVDEYIKKDGARRRCAGGDGRKNGNSDSSTELEERDLPEVVFDFKNERDANQFVKDVENSAVGLANSGVERYKGKYRVAITGMTKDMHKKAVAKYAEKNNGESSQAEAVASIRQLKDPKKEVLVQKKGEVVVIDRKDLKRYETKGWELAESGELGEKVMGAAYPNGHPMRKFETPASPTLKKWIESGKAKILDSGVSVLGPTTKFVVVQNPKWFGGDKHDPVLMFTISDPEKGRIKMFAFHGSHVSQQKAMQFAKNNKLVTTVKNESVEPISEDEQKLLDFINKNW